MWHKWGRGCGINQKYNAKLVEFARNLCNTDSWNWNSKPESHSACGLVRFRYRISVPLVGITEVSCKFHSFSVVFLIENKISLIYISKLFSQNRQNSKWSLILLLMKLKYNAEGQEVIQLTITPAKNVRKRYNEENIHTELSEKNYYVHMRMMYVYSILTFILCWEVLFTFSTMLESIHS